jgi:hypothetical protein
MSVELRCAVEGDCTCGKPRPVGSVSTCRHWIDSDWGIVEHTDPRPDLGQVGHLMVTHADYIRYLAKDGPYMSPTKGGRIDSVTFDGDRVFCHSEWRGNRWTWEVFDAHWWDHLPSEIMIGRWPD